MNPNPSSPTHHRFRGSSLDKALGAIAALLLIAVPPFVYGHIGIVYALIVLNGLLFVGLLETMATERAQAQTKSGSTKDEMPQNGLVVFDGMGSLPNDLCGVKDYLRDAHIAARAAQADHARKDTTPFLRLGTARGVFTGKPDPYAPDEGLPFGLSVGDLASHLIVFGSTCTGMTSNLRPHPSKHRGGRRGSRNKK